MEKAIEKLKAEMEKNKNNSSIQVIGYFLLEHLNNNPEDSEKVLQVGKTISGSLNEMRKEAEKKRVGNCAIVSAQECYGLVLKYFGINTAAPKVNVNPVHKVEPRKEESKAADFSYSLDDFLK